MKKLQLHTLLLFIVLSAANELSAQCFPDRHSTNWYEGWTSCAVKKSPNPQRDASHWMLINFDHYYNLKGSHWWNHNVPGSLENGVKLLAVDYSVDGISWNEWGNFSLDIASGDNFYEGQPGPDFGGIWARYILLSVIETHGGECAGLSELKIEVDFSSSVAQESDNEYCLNVSAYPNPFTSDFRLQVQSNCSSVLTWRLEDALGRPIQEQEVSGGLSDHIFVNLKDRASGIYYLTVHAGSQTIVKKLIKINSD